MSKKHKYNIVSAKDPTLVLHENAKLVSKEENTMTFDISGTKVRVMSKSSGLYCNRRKCLIQKGGTPKEPVIYYDLDFRRFPLCINPVELPTNIYLYRCGNSDAANVEAPRFLSNVEVAMDYMGPNKILFRHSFKRPVKLLDIRYLKYCLLQKLLEIKDNNNNNSSLDKNLDMLRLAYGLTGIEHQCEIAFRYKISDYKINKKDKHPPFQNCGDRFTNTDIDDIVIAVFKLYFGHEIDGYISPILDTVFGRRVDQEICLFNPKQVLCTQIVRVQDVLPSPSLHVSSIITKSSKMFGSYTVNVYS